MNFMEKNVIFFTFLTSCLGIALLSAGLSTEYWVSSEAYREVNPKAYGFVHFGLFKGSRKLNHGFGERNYPMDVLNIMYLEQDFMKKGLYIVTVASVCAGIFFGALSAFLSILNTATNQKEAVCHFPGLITLNFLASGSSVAAVVTWVIQFYSRLRKNVLIREDADKGGWKSEGRAYLGFSFWFMIVSSALFATNAIIFLVLKSKRKNKDPQRRQVIETKPNGNLMLY